MSEPNNGHAPTTSADKYTGAIILRTRPHTYKRVVRLLSEGVPAIRIARDCKVTERSVAAIAKREREEITERKKSLAGLMSNIAEIGGANVERKIGKASVRDAIIGTGVAIDKMLALTGQTPVGIQIANIQPPTPEQDEARRRAHHALAGITRITRREPHQGGAIAVLTSPRANDKQNSRIPYVGGTGAFASKVASRWQTHFFVVSPKSA